MNKLFRKTGIIALLLLLALFVGEGCSMVVTKKVRLTGSNQFMYLTKFAIGEGNAGYAKIRARLMSEWDYGPGKPDTIPLDFNFYTDENWDKVLEKDDSDCWGKANLQDIDQWINIPTWNHWSESVRHSFPIQRQTKVWYFAVCDCAHRAHMAFPTLPKVKIEITMRNNGSHFSQEDVYILPLYFIMFAAFCTFLGKSILEFYRDFKKEHTYENPLIPLMGSVTIDFFHLMFMLIHMIFVWEFGSGIIELGVFGRLLKVISQGSMMWLLITISFGWTITYRNMGEKDIYILSAIFIVMIHLLIGALTYIDDESHHKYHDFGGVQGVILVLLRLVIYGVFLYGIKETSNSANSKQKSFLWSLTVSASIYILSFPFLWVVSMVMDRYVINRFITFGTCAAQAFAAYYLLHQLTKKGSSYYNASHKSKTVLPGAKFD